MGDTKVIIDQEEGVSSSNKNPFHPLVWRLMLIVGVMLYGSFTIFVHLCEKNGRLEFSSASTVLVTEILKLCVCIVMLLVYGGFARPTLVMAIPYAVPALLYCVNNNIGVHMQLHMDPATYQMLGNMKIFSTAFLYRLILKKPITGLQWLALSLLALAGVCNSYGGLQTQPDDQSTGTIHITMVGLAMITLYCILSGLAGVYSEYILKTKFETSIHMQNSMLYMFGILLNGSTWAWGQVSSDVESVGLFHGYSVYTWLLVITQVASGLIMSAIFKYGNNITRLFLISCAMLQTTLVSMAIFHLQLNAYFCLSFILVIVALVLHHRH